MDSSTKNSVLVTPSKTHLSNRSIINKSPKDENLNPNLRNPDFKSSKSPIIKSSAPNSAKNKIRERKFVVVTKKKKKGGKEDSEKLACNCNERIGNKCLCVAYEILRASQEGFFKPNCEENGIETGVSRKIGDTQEEILEIGEMGSKRGREGENGIEIGDKVEDVPEPGSGKVMSLIKAFERLKTATPDSNDVDQKGGSEGNDKRRARWEFQIKALETQTSSSSICPSDFTLRSSLDSNQGSFTFSSKGSCAGRRIRRNSTESTGTYGGRRWRRKQQQLKATRQQPFKLLTEQRGKTKEEEFSKKLQEMMIEEQKQRIPIAQGLPWTTDEPENLVKPLVKDITIPVDLVLHSDVRAEERAEFKQQLAEKEALIEQYRMEKERQQKMAEEEEIKRLRKVLVPKAQPMPYFDRPFIPRRSEKQPTIPREPKFHAPPHEKKSKSCVSWNDFFH